MYQNQEKCIEYDHDAERKVGSCDHYHIAFTWLARRPVRHDASLECIVRRARCDQRVKLLFLEFPCIHHRRSPGEKDS